MKIRIKYTAILKIDNVQNGSELNVARGTTTSKLLSECNVKADHKRYIHIYVNGEKKSLSYTLQEGDKLYLALPIGGG